MPRFAKSQLLLLGQNDSLSRQPLTHVDATSSAASNFRVSVEGPGKLWCCVYFPLLPLEVLPGQDHSPRAVVAESGKRGRILICNRAAARQGIRPGLSVNAAFALVPDLEIHQQDERLEAKALKRLAAWAVSFTPVVSIDRLSRALSMEIRGSLKLFGGLERLREKLLADLKRRGHRAVVSCAPTARASLWLARAGQETAIAELQQLPGRLAQLQISCLDWPESTERKLRQMGIDTLGECIRLPRDGFARRIGQEKLQQLDQGFGRQPELQQPFQTPLRFDSGLDLPAETLDSSLLREALKHLLLRLERFLRMHQVGVRRLRLDLQHHKHPLTPLELGLLESRADVDYLMELAGLRFDALDLPAPVNGIRLRAEVMARGDVVDADLFGRQRAGRGRQHLHLVERLRARLGMEGVYGIRAVREHRPEYAWQVVNRLSKTIRRNGPAQHVGKRPLWVLESPVPLETVEGKPVHGGKLVLENGPERIETGWWDGKDIRRDYYIVRSLSGVRSWIFRDCRHSAWYLHGVFG
ncbi:MAG: DNA polymerase Y family protein [Gammaproteobacteria bacterium]|nr:DNA polymerase Y family protein [Gammaproteobacteria bacterium]